MRIVCQAANNLSVDGLYDKIQTLRIVQEMMDGLSPASLEFAEHEKATGGK